MSHSVVHFYCCVSPKPGRRRRCGPGWAPRPPADRSLGGPAVQFSASLVDTSGEPAEAFLDAQGEAFVHRLLLLAPLRGAAQDEGLGPVTGKLRLDTLTHRL